MRHLFVSAARRKTNFLFVCVFDIETQGNMSTQNNRQNDLACLLIGISRNTSLEQFSSIWANSSSNFHIHFLPQERIPLGNAHLDQYGVHAKKEWFTEHSWASIERDLAFVPDVHVGGLATRGIAIRPEIVGFPISYTTVHELAQTRTQLLRDAATFGMVIDQYIHAIQESLIQQYYYEVSEGKKQEQDTHETRFKRLQLLQAFKLIYHMQQNMVRRNPPPISAYEMLTNVYYRDRRPPTGALMQQLYLERSMNDTAKWNLLFLVAERLLTKMITQPNLISKRLKKVKTKKPLIVSCIQFSQPPRNTFHFPPKFQSLKTDINVTSFWDRVQRELSELSGFLSFEEFLIQSNRHLPNADAMIIAHSRRDSPSALFPYDSMVIASLFPPEFANHAAKGSIIPQLLMEYADELRTWMGATLFQVTFQTLCANARLDGVTNTFIARMPMALSTAIPSFMCHSQLPSEVIASLEAKRQTHQKAVFLCKRKFDPPLPKKSSLKQLGALFRGIFYHRLVEVIDVSNPFGHSISNQIQSRQYFIEKRVFITTLHKAKTSCGKLQKIWAVYYNRKARAMVKATSTSGKGKVMKKTTESTSDKEDASEQDSKQSSKWKTVKAKKKKSHSTSIKGAHRQQRRQCYEQYAKVNDETTHKIQQQLHDAKLNVDNHQHKLNLFLARFKMINTNDTTNAIKPCSECYKPLSIVKHKPPKTEKKEKDAKAAESKDSKEYIFLPNTGGLVLCQSCYKGFIMTAKPKHENKKTNEKPDVKDSKESKEGIRVLSFSEAVKDFIRPWIQPKVASQRRAVVPFSSITAFASVSEEELGDNVGSRLLKFYNDVLNNNNNQNKSKVANKKDMSAENVCPIVARDRANCGSCIGCRSQSICETSWYGAFLKITDVMRPDTRKPDKVVVIYFPGWIPAVENQVHEFVLMQKRIENDSCLRTEVNLRVFFWSEMDQLATQIGRLS